METSLGDTTVYLWRLPSLWLVLTAYLAVPVCLFWFLDRTGAVHDTSLFAALLVGLTYPTILAGKGSLKAPGELMGVLTNLSVAVDRLTSRLALSHARDISKFGELVVARMFANEANYSAVYARAIIAVQQGENAAAAKQALEKKIEETPDPTLKAAIVYEAAIGGFEKVANLDVVLKKIGLRKSNSPLFWAKWLRNLYAIIVVGLILIGLAGAFMPRCERAIAFWRLRKPDASSMDLWRTSHLVAGYLPPFGTDEATADGARHSIVEILDRPGLPSDRIDLILSLVLRSRGDVGSVAFGKTVNSLLDAYRVAPFDVRVRIHPLLDRMANEYPVARRPKEGMTEAWAPAPGDTIVASEKKWQSWHEWWKTALQ